MTRLADADLDLRADVHVTPDPRTVYRLIRTHGIGAACERWSWLRRSQLLRLGGHGRAQEQLARGAFNRQRRHTPAQEAEIVAAVFELGGVDYVCRAHGVTATLVLQLLAERGIRDYPRASRTPAAVAAARARLADYLARRAA